MNGIYKVECLVDGRLYIGASQIIVTREGHYKDLSMVYNYDLHQSYLKHGKDKHVFSRIQIIPEPITKKELFAIERAYIDALFDAGFNLFNWRPGTPKRKRWEKVQGTVKQKVERQCIPIICYRFDTKDVLKEFPSIKQAGEELLITVPSIKANLGRPGSFSNVNIDGHLRKVRFEYKYKIHEKKENRSNPFGEPKPVIQICPKTEMILQVHQSLREAADQTGIPISNISMCANSKLLTAGKFKWVFLSDMTDNSITDEEALLSTQIENSMQEKTDDQKKDEVIEVLKQQLQTVSNARKEMKARFISDVALKFKKK